MGLKTWLGLKKPYAASHTVKPWPGSLAEDHEGPIVTFGIPLKSARSSGNWTLVASLLGATLRSVFRQTDPRWRVLICGHEKPDIPEMNHPGVEFIAGEWHAPSLGEGHLGLSDQFQKRSVIARRFREVGGGYYMDLDGDDLIHRDLVATALASQHGCIITSGYIRDMTADVIAPLPGALSVDFDRVCGSMAIVRYSEADIPEIGKHETFVDQTKTLFGGARHHAYLRGRAEEIGRPLSVVPFPAGVYTINTNENYSMIHLRDITRQPHLISLVHDHAVTDPAALNRIAEDFGWEAPLVAEPASVSA